ncbi:membrane integrity-associated transporter subunit PqiC [Sulfurospirillum diekertiae]|uniref:Lipoprotein n=1 Tax=Sulfurospirillum diekertiae TaxID=1854492 RepID=A0A290HNP8_9BACT|nr:ABC-type transport auxiliary lipoprotein family protein [Sulfurospirillum diekertiae]ATB68264.1 putative lipoprotein [Sulfurospirillum diekertiae]QIR76126.1 membrane integrity-associated transporter subunit PqiC [Sulfurospirillum diekertiae]QIR78765.1 membrane integrity-associated transporter subunit PqiC [Sulfurospirillum diekertiae]
MKNVLLTLTTLVLLSGCSIKETSQRPYNYSLEPMMKLERFSVANQDVLKVAYIDAPSGLNSRAIVYKKEGAMLPYKYGVWSETPPLKLQYLITEALQDQHHFGSVISGTSMASNNLVLEPVIQNFEEVFREDGTSYVHVSIRFRLVEIKTGEVLGSTKLSSKRDVTNTHGAEGAVEAFNTATEDVIKSLSIWINELRK